MLDGIRHEANTEYSVTAERSLSAMLCSYTVRLQHENELDPSQPKGEFFYSKHFSIFFVKRGLLKIWRDVYLGRGG